MHRTNVPWILAFLLPTLAVAGCFEAEWSPASDPDLPGDAGGDGGELGGCPNPQVALGTTVGSVIENVTLEDAEREEHALYQRCGEVVLVGIGAGWCTACREEMPELSRMHNEIDGFSVYYVLFQDTDSSPASTSTLQAWNDSYSPPFPVLKDPLDIVRSKYAPGHNAPISVLLNRSMVIELVRGELAPDQLRPEIERLLDQ